MRRKTRQTERHIDIVTLFIQGCLSTLWSCFEGQFLVPRRTYFPIRTRVHVNIMYSFFCLYVYLSNKDPSSITVYSTVVKFPARVFVRYMILRKHIIMYIYSFQTATLQIFFVERYTTQKSK